MANNTGIGGFMQNPWVGLGANLMTAGGPMRTPASFGSRMGGAVLNAQSQYEQQLQDQLRRKQMEMQNTQMQKKLDLMDREVKIWEDRQKMREKAAGIVERMGAQEFEADTFPGEAPPEGNYTMNPWAKMAAGGLRTGDDTMFQMGLGGLKPGGIEFQGQPGYGGAYMGKNIYGNPEILQTLSYSYPSATAQLMGGLGGGLGVDTSSPQPEVAADEGPGFFDRLLGFGQSGSAPAAESAPGGAAPPGPYYSGGGRQGAAAGNVGNIEKPYYDRFMAMRGEATPEELRALKTEAGSNISPWLSYMIDRAITEKTGRGISGRNR